MSLDWDLTRCPFFKEIYSEEEWETTRQIIFLTVIVEVGQLLTEEDIDEFAYRVKLLEGMRGAYMKWMPKGKGPLEEWPMLRSVIAMRKGLTVNVGTIPFEEWVKEMFFCQVVDNRAETLKKYEEEWQEEPDGFCLSCGRMMFLEEVCDDCRVRLREEQGVTNIEEWRRQQVRELRRHEGEEGEGVLQSSED